MWKAAFTGRSETAGSTSGKRKKSRTSGSDSVVSSASTATPSKTTDDSRRRTERPARSGSLTESAMRALTHSDEEWEDDERDKYARSEGRSTRGDDKTPRRRRSEREGKRSGSDRDGTSERRRDRSENENGGRDRAIPAMGSFAQFPGQFDGTGMGSSGQQAAVMGSAPQRPQADGRLPQAPDAQFIGPSRADSFGAAADYYLDEGQSVQNQPGVRQGTPNMLVNPDTHLQAASAEAHPAQDTGHGSAAEFYGEAAPIYTAEPESIAPTTPANSSRPSRPPGRTSSSGSAVGGMVVTSYTSKINGSGPRPSTGLSAASSGAYYGPPPGEQSHGTPGKYTSSPGSNTGMYAVGAAAAIGAAGIAAYEMKQHHHQTPPAQSQSYSTTTHITGSQRPPSFGQPPSGVYTNGSYSTDHRTQQLHYHEHKSPAARLKDGILGLISTEEDVVKMEMYTEYIGVCKYCFDPRSSPYDAPRQHHWHPRRDSFDELRRRRSVDKMRRRSKEYLNRRVDKESRYSSDKRRTSPSRAGLVGAGLAAAGLAAGANAIMRHDGKDFDDTYSVKSGRQTSSDVRRRSRSSSRERRRKTIHGTIGPDREEYVTVRTEDGRLEKRRVRQRSGAPSKDQKSSGLFGALAGATLGAAAVGEGSSRRRRTPSRSPSRSPGLGRILGFSGSDSNRREKRGSNGRYVDLARRPSGRREGEDPPPGFFGSFFSTPSRSRHGSPRRQEHRRKEKTGLFNFGNASSSSEEGLAFGEGFASRQSLPLRRKSSRASVRRKTSDERIAATVAGIGATAAALAAAQKGHRLSRQNGTRPELGPGKDVRRLQIQEQHHGPHGPDDDEWVDELPSDVDDASSVGSALAFGDYGHLPKKRESMESLASHSSDDGLSAWGWRWGGKDKRKPRRQDALPSHPSHYGEELVGTAAAGAVASVALDAIERQHRTPSTAIPPASTPQGPMQYVDPRPVSDDADLPQSRHPSMPGGYEPEPAIIRPGPGPLQQPRPVDPTQRPSFTQNLDDPVEHPLRSKPQRTMSSPVHSSGSMLKDAALIGAAAIGTAGIIASQNRKSSKDVRFGLTDEQQAKEDREQKRLRDKQQREEEARKDRERAVREEAERYAREQDVLRRRQEDERRAAEARVTAQAEAEARDRREREQRQAQREWEEQQARRVREDWEEKRRQRDEQERELEARIERNKRELEEQNEHERERQQVEDARHAEQRVHDSPGIPWTAIGAGAAAAATVGAVYAGIEHERQEENDHASGGNRSEHAAATWEIKPELTHDAAITEDDLADPAFFKRKRSPSNQRRAEELAQIAADRIVSERDEYYKQPQQSQADFFAPKDILDQMAEGKTGVADPDSQQAIQVWHSADSEVRRHMHFDPELYGPPPAGDYGPTRYAPRGIPRLDLISPTPPPAPSATKPPKQSSPLSRDTSAGAEDDKSEQRRSRSISWANEHQTHVYDAPSPEHDERDSYVDGRHSARTTAEPGVAIAAAAVGAAAVHEYIVESPSPGREPEIRTYRDDEIVDDEDRDDNLEEVRDDMGGDTETPNFAYRRPFYESVSDVGVGGISHVDSPGTEGAPPVRGFVEGETEEPTPAEEVKQRHVPGGFEDEQEGEYFDPPSASQPMVGLTKLADHEAREARSEGMEGDAAWEPPLSKKERKKREKTAKRSSTIDDATVEPAEDSVVNSRRDSWKGADSSTAPRQWDTPDTQPSEDLPVEEWQPPRSKKDKKKSSKRSSVNDNNSTATPAEWDSTETPVEEESKVEDWDPPLRKKDKKKASKRASAFDEPPGSPVALDTCVAPDEEAPMTGDWEPQLSKKEQKKREKEAKKLGFANVADMLVAKQAEAEREPKSGSSDIAPQLTAHGREKKTGFANVAEAMMAAGGVAAAGAAVYADQSREPDVTHDPEAASMPGGWSSDRERAEESSAEMPDPFQYQIQDEASPPSLKAAEEEVEPEEGFAPAKSSKKSKKKEKKKRDSLRYGGPEVSSPLRTEGTADDYVGRSTEGAVKFDQSNGVQHGRAELPSFPRLEDERRSEQTPDENEYAPMSESPRRLSIDGERSTDTASRGGRDQRRTSDGERSNRHGRYDDDGDLGRYDEARPISDDSRRVDTHSHDERDRHRESATEHTYSDEAHNYDLDPDPYEDARSNAGTSVAGSDERRRKRRSKVDEDDAVSVVSSRSRRERDDDKDKKGKKGGIFGLFSRKSSEPPSRADGASLSRMSTRNSQDEGEDGERRRRRKHHGLVHGDEEDDGKSVSSGSKHHHHRSSSKCDDEEPEDERSHHHRRRTDEDPRSTVSYHDSEGERRRHHHHRDDDDNDQEDQSFLETRVEDMPPLPASEPVSPTSASDDKNEQGFGSPDFAKQPVHTESGSESRGLAEAFGSTRDEHHPDQSSETLTTEGLGFASASEPSSHQQDTSESELSSARREVSLDPLYTFPELPHSRPGSPTAEVEQETPQRPASIQRPTSTTSVPLRFPFGHSPVISSHRVERAASFAGPLPHSPVSPLSAKQTRQGRPPSTEFRPLYLVEHHRHIPEVEDTLPSLPSSKPSSRAPSQIGSEEYESAAEEFDTPERRRSALRIDTGRTAAHKASEDYLDSQQTTPKASEFTQPRSALERHARQEPEFYTWKDLEESAMQHAQRPKPQFYTWQDFEEDERMHDVQGGDETDEQSTSIQHEVSRHDNDDLPALPASRPETPSQNTVDEGIIAGGIGAIAALGDKADITPGRQNGATESNISLHDGGPFGQGPGRSETGDFLDAESRLEDGNSGERFDTAQAGDARLQNELERFIQIEDQLEAGEIKTLTVEDVTTIDDRRMDAHERSHHHDRFMDETPSRTPMRPTLESTPSAKHFMAVPAPVVATSSLDTDSQPAGEFASQLTRKQSKKAKKLGKKAAAKLAWDEIVTPETAPITSTDQQLVDGRIRESEPEPTEGIVLAQATEERDHMFSGDISHSRESLQDYQPSDEVFRQKEDNVIVPGATDVSLAHHAAEEDWDTSPSLSRKQSKKAERQSISGTTYEPEKMESASPAHGNDVPSESPSLVSVQIPAITQNDFHVPVVHDEREQIEAEPRDVPLPTNKELDEYEDPGSAKQLSGLGLGVNEDEALAATEFDVDTGTQVPKASTEQLAWTFGSKKKSKKAKKVGRAASAFDKQDEPSSETGGYGIANQVDPVPQESMAEPRKLQDNSIEDHSPFVNTTEKIGAPEQAETINEEFTWTSSSKKKGKKSKRSSRQASTYGNDVQETTAVDETKNTAALTPARQEAMDQLATLPGNKAYDQITVDPEPDPRAAIELPELVNEELPWAQSSKKKGKRLEKADRQTATFDTGSQQALVFDDSSAKILNDATSQRDEAVCDATGSPLVTRQEEFPTKDDVDETAETLDPAVEEFTWAPTSRKKGKKSKRSSQPTPPFDSELEQESSQQGALMLGTSRNDQQGYAQQDRINAKSPPDRHTSGDLGQNSLPSRDTETEETKEYATIREVDSALPASPGCDVLDMPAENQHPVLVASPDAIKHNPTPPYPDNPSDKRSDDEVDQIWSSTSYGKKRKGKKWRQSIHEAPISGGNTEVADEAPQTESAFPHRIMDDPGEAVSTEGLDIATTATSLGNEYAANMGTARSFASNADSGIGRTLRTTEPNAEPNVLTPGGAGHIEALATDPAPASNMDASPASTKFENSETRNTVLLKTKGEEGMQEKTLAFNVNTEYTDRATDLVRDRACFPSDGGADIDTAESAELLVTRPGSDEITDDLQQRREADRPEEEMLPRLPDSPAIDAKDDNLTANDPIETLRASSLEDSQQWTGNYRDIDQSKILSENCGNPSLEEVPPDRETALDRTPENEGAGTFEIETETIVDPRAERDIIPVSQQNSIQDDEVPFPGQIEIPRHSVRNYEKDRKGKKSKTSRKTTFDVLEDESRSAETSGTQDAVFIENQETRLATSTSSEPQRFVPPDAERSVEEDALGYEPTTTGKKNKKKNKKSKASSLDWWAEESSNSQTAGNDNGGKDSDELEAGIVAGTAIVGASAIASAAVAAATGEVKAEEDDWSGFSTKKKKKKKGSSKKSETLAPDDQMEEGEAQVTSVNLPSEADRNRSAPRNVVGPFGDSAREMRGGYIEGIVNEDEATKIPLPIIDDDERLEDDALPVGSADSTKLPESTEPEYDVLRHNSRSVQGYQRISQENRDAEFHSTVAAGLAESGFSPDIVVEDAIFQHRASPTSSQGEADPQEIMAPAIKRQKRKDRRRNDASPHQSDSNSAEGSDERTLQRHDDFNETLENSLSGTGFSIDLLRQATVSGIDDTAGETVQYPYSTNKRKKGKGYEPLQAMTHDEQYIDPSHDTGNTEQEVPIEATTVFQPGNQEEEPGTLDGTQPDFAAPHTSALADRAADLVHAGDKDLDVDEMDNAYRTYKRNKRKQRKQKWAMLQSDSDPSSQIQATETSREREGPEPQTLELHNTARASDAEYVRQISSEPNYEADLAGPVSLPKELADHEAIYEPASQNTNEMPSDITDKLMHTSEVSQHMPIPVYRRSPSQTSRDATADIVMPTKDASRVDEPGEGSAGVATSALSALDINRVGSVVRMSRSGHHGTDRSLGMLPGDRVALDRSRSRSREHLPHLTHHQIERNLGMLPGEHTHRQLEPQWSFNGLNADQEPALTPPLVGSREHEVARDSGYQEINTPMLNWQSKETMDYNSPRARDSRSNEDLHSRRSSEPLHISTDTGANWELRTPERRGNRQPESEHLRTASHETQETPLESTTKNRASYLFQATPETMRDIPSTTETVSPPSGMQGTPGYFRPRVGSTVTDEEAVLERSVLSPPPQGVMSPRTPLDTIPEEFQAQKRTITEIDDNEPESVKAVRRTETPQNIRARAQQLSMSVPLVNDKPVAAPLSTDALIGQLAWPSVDEEQNTVNVDRAFQHMAPSRATDPRSPSVMSNRSTASAGPLKSPPELRSYSRTSTRSSEHKLRRASLSCDLRAASRRGDTGSAVGSRSSPKTIPFEAPPTPPSNDDEVMDAGAPRSADMSDIYQGYGDAQASQVSPTRPPSMRKRQSMHILELESKLDQVMAENQALQGGRSSDEPSDRNLVNASMQEALHTRDLQLREKDTRIGQIQAMLKPMQDEIARLNEINEGLTEANRNLVDDTNGRYATLQQEHAQAHEQWQGATRDLEDLRREHGRVTSGMRDQVSSALAEKDVEIRQLREELDLASERIRSLQVQIQTTKGRDYLSVRDEDYFDGACQKLCQHVQQWVLRFSKVSDNRVCRLSADITDEKVEARLDNAILDGSDVDKLLLDRVKRRDVFMSVLMTMVWEYVFTRYLFGMDREQRQKLKALEKILAEVGPPRAVSQWRATTLTLLSKRPAFAEQRALDTEAVTNEVFALLCALLPPPSNVEQQLLASLQKVISIAIDISIEMRTQRAEYIMLPPLLPEYDTNGDLVHRVHFNASLMNERSGMFASNQELEQTRAVVKIVLFPLVVMKGDEWGEGEEEIVVCPAQVLVQNENGKGKRVVRVSSGAVEISDPRRSRQSLMSGVESTSGF